MRAVTGEAAGRLQADVKGGNLLRDARGPREEQLIAARRYRRRELLMDGNIGHFGHGLLAQESGSLAPGFDGVAMARGGFGCSIREEGQGGVADQFVIAINPEVIGLRSRVPAQLDGAERV